MALYPRAFSLPVADHRHLFRRRDFPFGARLDDLLAAGGASQLHGLQPVLEDGGEDALVVAAVPRQQVVMATVATATGRPRREEEDGRLRLAEVLGNFRRLALYRLPDDVDHLGVPLVVSMVMVVPVVVMGLFLDFPSAVAGRRLNDGGLVLVQLVGQVRGFPILDPALPAAAGCRSFVMLGLVAAGGVVVAQDVSAMDGGDDDDCWCVGRSPKS